VGVEREAPLLAVAGDVIEERGLTNVRLVQGDATATGLPRAAFDLVHERLLLMITPAVGRVLAEMIALARPGGVVVVQDLDVVSMICEPAHPAWTRLVGDGIQTDVELTALVDAVRRHLARPGTLVLQPLLTQAWGTTPRPARRDRLTAPRRASRRTWQCEVSRALAASRAVK